MKFDKWKFVLVVIILMVGVFYWHQIRPSVIYSQCNKIAHDKEYSERSFLIEESYELNYKDCLRSKGINK